MIGTLGKCNYVAACSSQRSGARDLKLDQEARRRRIGTGVDMNDETQWMGTNPIEDVMTIAAKARDTAKHHKMAAC